MLIYGHVAVERHGAQITTPLTRAGNLSSCLAPMQRQTVGSLGRISSGRKRLLRTEAVVLAAPKGWRPKHREAQVTRWHVAPRAVLAKRTRPASGDLLLPRVRAGYSRHAPPRVHRL
ncbi:hypothetical protein MTO96_006628 [Rhipicephalus appendiculatus]